MWALTLPVSAAFARSMLQASLSQSGKTPVTNAMRSPEGAHTGPLAPPLTFVICRAFTPLASAIHSWPLAVYATHLPSGDQRASAALVLLSGQLRAAPP